MEFTVNANGPTVLITCSIEMLHAYLFNIGEMFEHDTQFPTPRNWYELRKAENAKRSKDGAQ